MVYIDMGEMGSMDTRQEVLHRVKELPPLSTSTVELLSIMSEDDKDLHKIIRVVECDAGLTARVLRIVNSPAFGLMESITSIHRAVSYLGQKMLVGIALDAAVGSILRQPLKGYEDSKGLLWEHNLRAAIGSKEVARFAKQDISPDIAFTGGILHDIGKAVLSDFLSGSAGNIISKIDTGESKDYLAGEQQTVGIDHSVVGYELARKWNLASPLPDIIRFHHNPSKAEGAVKAVVYAVHLGDIISMMGGSGTGSDDLMYYLDPHFHAYIEISERQLEELMLKVQFEFERIKKCIFDREGKDS